MNFVPSDVFAKFLPTVMFVSVLICKHFKENNSSRPWPSYHSSYSHNYTTPYITSVLSLGKLSILNVPQYETLKYQMLNSMSNVKSFDLLINSINIFSILNHTRHGTYCPWWHQLLSNISNFNQNCLFYCNTGCTLVNVSIRVCFNYIKHVSLCSSITITNDDISLTFVHLSMILSPSYSLKY